MLSYRHEFHAGNAADVLKHAVFVFLLRYLQRKETPALVLDTHAGAGLYRLDAPQALKTGEFRGGIGQVLPWAGDAPDLLRDYLAAVAACNPDGALAVYPGSASLATALRRPKDRVVLFELHSTDHAALAARMRHKTRVTVVRGDGLTALAAHLPPPERRALVLIDPSYEVKDDYAAVPSALARAWRRFPGGVYVLWYPVIERGRAEAVAAAVAAAGVRRVYRLELCPAPDAPGHGMTGSGLLVVNPPHVLPAAAAEALPWLGEVVGARGPVGAHWVVGEDEAT